MIEPQTPISTKSVDVTSTGIKVVPLESSSRGEYVGATFVFIAPLEQDLTLYGSQVMSMLPGTGQDCEYSL